MQDLHQPVLLKETLAALIIDENGRYIDATFGRGGHSKAILASLSARGRLIALDRDPEAYAAAEMLQQDKRFHRVKAPFAEIERIAEQFDLVGKISGILFDLGVSSPQLDDPRRGFSFLKEGPLDMRMDPTIGMDAGTWINQASAAEISNVLKEYGEERFHKRIANFIVAARKQQPITTTTTLAAIIAKANPKWEAHKHPATRSFQGIRIFINNELEQLETALAASLRVLEPGGRIAVISFHSLEDRIVKRFIRQQERGEDLPRGLPIKDEVRGQKLKKIGKAITPSEAEIKQNPRARSAILRIAEKLT